MDYADTQLLGGLKSVHGEESMSPTSLLAINVELRAAVSYFGKNEPDATEIRMKGYSST